MEPDFGNLLPDEKYAVEVMRREGKVIHADIHGGPLLYCEEVPVCTWDTLFRLLGKEVCRYFPATKRYGLTEAWR
jgi:hypothetical protein